MKFYLIVAKGKKQGMPIPVEIDLFLIGSGPVCQLRAVHDDIGDQHCAVVTRGRKVFVSRSGQRPPHVRQWRSLDTRRRVAAAPRATCWKSGRSSSWSSIAKRPCRSGTSKNGPSVAWIKTSTAKRNLVVAEAKSSTPKSTSKPPRPRPPSSTD